MLLQSAVGDWPCIFLSKYFVFEIFLWIFTLFCASCKGSMRGNLHTWTSVMHLMCQPYRIINQNVTAPLMTTVVLCVITNCRLYPTWMDSVRDVKVACLRPTRIYLRCLGSAFQCTHNVQTLYYYVDISPSLIMSYAHW